MQNNLIPHSMRKLSKLRFRFYLLKAKTIHNQGVKLNLRILKFCLYNINKCGIPTNKCENDRLKELIDLYDITLRDLNSSVDRYRNYIS